MKSLLNADDDWMESVRFFLYPKLHGVLTAVGTRVGTPMYAVGRVGMNQYVGRLDEGEETIEEELVAVGFQRNPIAAFKQLKDGRTSEGSWALRHGDAPEHIEPGMQLHITLFERDDGEPGRELYAHYEDDWRASATGHLRSANFSAQEGVLRAEDYFDHQTFLTLKE